MIAKPFSKKRAVLYARVSSDEQEREGYSIPAQKKLLIAYAADKGFDIVEEYIEVETAKQAGRKSFNAMVDFLKKQKTVRDPEKRCSVILVEKTDRLYRNLKDWVTMEDLDVEIHFVKESVVLSEDSRSNERFVHGIKVLMAKQYVENLGEEAKKGMKEKAQQGIWPHKAPLGYLNVTGPDGRKIITTDPDTFDIVARMFERYATGNYSLEEVGEMARDEGLRFKQSGNLRSVIQYLFKNPFYYGDYVWGGEKISGTHTPMVTRQLWDKVQEQRLTRSNRKTRKPKKRDFAFSRLIRCGQCGCALVGEMKKGKYIYYHCTEFKQKCGEKYVREEALEEKFTEILRTLRFDDDVLAWLTKALRESQADETKFREESVSRLQGEYNTLQRRIDAMYLDKLDGRIDVAFFDAKRSEWRDEQDRITEAIGDHQRANESYINEGVMLVELANRAADLFERQPPKEKRKLLDFVLSNCEWSGGVLTPVFRQPFDMIADTAIALNEKKAAGMSSSDLCQAKLPRQDSNLRQAD